MKFGKSIRAESRANRGLAFLNFKYLKKLLKTLPEESIFRSCLDAELNRVANAYWAELKQISELTTAVVEASARPFAVAGEVSEITRERLSQLSTFDELQQQLQSLSGKEEHTALLCDFCVSLGQLSARCKRLRGCVLWNVLAVVKILKKRQKKQQSITITAMEVLSLQEWCRDPQLPKLVSTVDTSISEFMYRLTRRPPTLDEYRCPICLDVVFDPVCLRTCGHRFCWACLCQTYLNCPEGTLERCPTCRASFTLDPLAFQVDGILSRFLRNYFPDELSSREKEQKETLKRRLAAASGESQPHNNLLQLEENLNCTLVRYAAAYIGTETPAACALPTLKPSTQIYNSSHANNSSHNPSHINNTSHSSHVNNNNFNKNKSKHPAVISSVVRSLIGETDDIEDESWPTVTNTIPGNNTTTTINAETTSDAGYESDQEETELVEGGVCCNKESAREWRAFMRETRLALARLSELTPKKWEIITDSKLLPALPLQNELDVEDENDFALLQAGEAINH